MAGKKGTLCNFGKTDLYRSNNEELQGNVKNWYTNGKEQEKKDLNIQGYANHTVYGNNVGTITSMKTMNVTTNWNQKRGTERGLPTGKNKLKGRTNQDKLIQSR